jgi:hypothetical protein
MNPSLPLLILSLISASLVVLPVLASRHGAAQRQLAAVRASTARRGMKSSVGASARRT